MNPELTTPAWIRRDLSAEAADYGPGAFMTTSFYSTSSGDDLDTYYRSPGFRVQADHEDGGLETTQEMRYLMVGLIGTPNICSISGGVVVPIRDGIDLPVGDYRVRVVNDYGADMFVVSRIHVVDGQERVEGSIETDVVGVSELTYRAGMFRTWDATEWTDLEQR
jgi:hypothetical protein